MSSNIRPVGRKRINEEEMPARFPKGTLAQVDGLLSAKEKRADFIRAAVDREIRRRKLRRAATAVKKRAAN
jgi:hypothetical protein